MNRLKDDFLILKTTNFMPMTKQRKITLVGEMQKKFTDSKATVFADFDKLSTSELNKLRRELKKAGAELKVVKKTLLDLVLKKTGVSFDPSLLKTQLSAIFASGDLMSIAGLVHKFVKDVAKSKVAKFGVLGAYNADEKRFVDSNEFKIIATLPSREVLLAQIAMMLTMPIKQLLMVLNERSKTISNH